jgi:hypothetical protein
MKVVISTHDDYAWIVPVFLHFYKKYWPDNPYETVIITENDHIDGTVFYTRGVSWSSGLIKYLKQSDDDKILLLLEDCFLDKPIDTERVQHAENLCNGNVGCVNLKGPERYRKNHSIKSKVKGFGEYPLNAKYSVSILPVIYQKDYLLDVLRENEGIWKTELEGSSRAGKLKDKWRLLWAEDPIINFHGSLLHRGQFRFKHTKWAIQELLNINNKIVFIDVGELGWSLYLSAHIRWLKKNTDSQSVVIGFPDRRCLYKGLVEEFIEVPRAFYKKYDINNQDSCRIRKVGWDELNSFFFSYVPSGYRFAGYKEYPTKIISDKRIFAPYEYSRRPERKREIIIFPRCRHGLWTRRNLSKEFYIRIIKNLCDVFPKMRIRTVGTKEGAYNIDLDRRNYINWVGKGDTLQDLINKCQSAVIAVGSQSAPPKLALLQGLPTFIIGHQRKRHIKTENWMNTKVGFYEIKKDAYETFNKRGCIKAIINFVKEVK